MVNAMGLQMPWWRLSLFVIGALARWLMAVQAAEPNVQPLYHSFRTARGRLWWQRGIRTAARSVCISLAFTLAAALLAAWQAPRLVLDALWAAAGLSPLVGLLAALALRPSIADAVRTVDQRLDLAQQLGTAEELMARKAAGRLVSLQIARAAELASEAPVSRVFPLLPNKEIRIALPLALLTAFFLILVSLGVVLPNPLSLIRMPHFAGQAATPASQQDALNSLGKKSASTPGSPALDPLRRTLDELRRQAQQGTLTPAAAAAMLAQANAQLNRLANDSRDQQQALDQLANELQSTAAGREAAESLRQGNYDKAAQQLRDVGLQSDQLSQVAKQQLADALSRAAQKSQNARDLARSENQAAGALQRGDYSSVVQSMNELSQSVQDAAGQIVSQDELAQSWQQLQDLAEQLGDPGSQHEGAVALSPPVAQAPQAGGERSATLPSANPADGQQNGAGQGDSRNGGQQGLGSGMPGNSSGGPPLGNPNPRQAIGNGQLDIQGKIGDRFPGDGSPSTEPPSVRRSGTAQSDASAPSQGYTGTTSVPAENVFVPGERKSTIRDYFSAGSKGQ